MSGNVKLWCGFKLWFCSSRMPELGGFACHVGLAVLKALFWIFDTSHTRNVFFYQITQVSPTCVKQLMVSSSVQENCWLLPCKIVSSFRNRSCVSELYSGHVIKPVWLWWNSISLCIRFLFLLPFPCMHNESVNLMTWIANVVCWKVLKLQFLVHI